MKTIKIIDLLNKIANDEEVPHFIVEGQEYYLGADGYLKNSFGDEVEWLIYKEWLNKEVKIIEEKEIEKVSVKTNNHNVRKVANKINELIDTINELKRGN